AGLEALDVRDDQRTVFRIERAATSGLDVDWPARVTVERVALRRPWLLVERDPTGELALRPLLAPRPVARPGAPAGGPPPAPAAEGTAPATTSSPAPADTSAASARPDEPPPLAVAIAEVAIEDGGLRVVDRAISPAFALDVHALGLRANGLSTGPARPARIEL